MTDFDPRSRPGAYPIDTQDGWQLRLQHAGLSGGAPVLCIPGYGMNDRLFHRRPGGPPLVQALLRAGLDVWTLDPRTCRSAGRKPDAGPTTLVTLASQDVATALDIVRAATQRDRVSIVGCSLGGTVALLAALDKPAAIDRIVLAASPVAWPRSSLTRILTGLSPILGRLPVRGTRTAASFLLKPLGRLGLLAPYLNSALTDIWAADALIPIVEDPVPSLNADLIRWMHSGAVAADGEAFTTMLSAIENPTLVLWSRGDGIVPPASALAVVDALGVRPSVQEVMSPDGARVGHADLFVSRISESAVHQPIATFLTMGR